MYEGFSSGPAQDALDRYGILKELGDCHAALGDDHKARGYYEDARDLAPERGGAYVGLGILAMHEENLDEARRAFETARHLDPQCAKAYGGLAMMFHQNHDYPRAFEMYLKCLELDTNNLIALLGLFQASCQMGTFGKIIYYLEVFLQMHPDDTAVLFCLATLHAREGRFTEAGSALRRVLELEPDKVEAAKLLAQVTSSLAGTVPQEALV